MKIYILKISFLVFLFTIHGSSQSVIINEFLSSNSQKDANGNNYDWIELYNSGTSTVNLNNYLFTDDTTDLTKWKFPDIEIEPDSFLLLLASGNDIQKTTRHWETLINWGDNWHYFVGISEPSSNWKTLSFDETAWQEGESGFGYGDNDDATVISNTISVFIRKKFLINDIENISDVLLHIDYDDAFVAYLNGVEIARSNIGSPNSFTSYDQGANSNHEAVIYSGGFPEKFIINDWDPILTEGENVLAIQVHNIDANSSDLTAIPFLTLGMINKPDVSNGSSEILNLNIPAVETNFKIDADGEYLVLSDAEGNEIDKVFTGFLPADISKGRYPDGADQWFYFNEPTPGYKNSDSYFSNIESEPEFSSPAGFYDSQISLSLTNNNASSKIFYTLDGTEPDTNSMSYSSPILLNTTSVIRAKVFGENSLHSKTVTNTYIFNEDFTMPVISLTTDPVNLWDEETGIYVKGNNAESNEPYYGANFWEDWEKPIHIEFFEPTGELAFSQDAGVKIFGAWSRAHDQKSLAIYARSIYGKGSFNYQIFPDITINKFESFILRNSGNDWYYSLIRDAFMTILASKINIDVQAYRPAIIFINGEYWGIQNIREKISEHFIASHYNFDTKDINLLENSSSIINGTNENYLNLLNFLNNNSLSNKSNYEFVKNIIDVDNFINYMVLEIYYDNQDWPGNNIKFWNSTSKELKWRWIMYDTDYSFGIYDHNAYTNYTLDFATAANGPYWPNPPWSTLLLRKLIENNEFKNEFINRYSDLTNSILQPEYISEIIDSIFILVQPEMQRHKERWGQSYSDWLNEIDYLHEFAENRESYVQSNFESKFNLSGISSFEITGDSTKGFVQVNSLKIKTFPWEGSYFQNIPIQLEAVPTAGHKFSHWEGYNSSERIITVLPENISEISAVFETDSGSSNSIVINEINYNSSEEFNSEDWVELYNNTDSTINLSGWIFKDSDDLHSYIIPDGITLLTDNYIVLVRDSLLFTQAYPEVENYIGSLNFGFDGSGELLRLYDNNLSLIDSLTYDDNSPWPEEADGEGKTLSLINPNLDNSIAENWKASGGVGTPGRINDISVSVDEEKNNIPSEFKLEQNYPNPFNPSTKISYSIPHETSIRLKIYDILGNEIITLVNENQKAGNYLIDFNGEEISSGIYIATIIAGNFVKSIKMSLIK